MLIDLFCYSFKKIPEDEAASTLFDYLTFLDTSIDAGRRRRILASVNPTLKTFMDCQGSSPNELMALAAALHKVGESHGGRLVILWILACHGNAFAANQMINDLHKILNHARYSGPVLVERLRSALDTWHAEEMAFLASDAQPLPVEAQVDDEQASMIVVESIGDPKSKEGQDLAARYKNLIAKPVPLRGRIDDLTQIYDRLSLRFPWAKNAIELICGQLALTPERRRSCPVIRPMLFVGSPGCGKTQLAADLFSMLRLPHSLLPCGGTSDSGGLLAVGRGWATSRPNGLIEAMQLHNCANPGVIVDEVDKGTSSSRQSPNGNLEEALLSMLDRKNLYNDACLMANVDLSAVNLIFTANSLKPLSDAFEDRMEIVHLPSPSSEHFETIYRNLRASIGREMGGTEADVPELEQHELAILQDVLLEPSPSIRQIEKRMQRILGTKALEAIRSAPTRERSISPNI